MKEQFVTYEIALALKELGFNEPCLAYYTTGNDVTLNKDGNPTNFVLLSEKLRGELVGHGSVKNELFKWLKDNDRTNGELYTLSESITAPLWQQAIDWFREKHNLSIDIYTISGFSELIYSWDILTKNNVYQINNFKIGSDKSFYKMREQAILKAIELCKNK